MKQPGLRQLAIIGVAFATASCSELASSTGFGNTGTQARPQPSASQPAADTGAKTSSASGVYAITFGVRSGSKLGAVQFDARGSGDWQGSGDKVACSSLVSGSMHACNDKGGGVLSCGLINTSGIPGGADLVRCDFASKSPVSAGDFSVRVIDASNTATKPVSANVVVKRAAAR